MGWVVLGVECMGSELCCGWLQCIVAILSMADMVCLKQKLWSVCMSWVCMVCWSKLRCEILLLLNMADMDYVE